MTEKGIEGRRRTLSRPYSFLLDSPSAQLRVTCIRVNHPTFLGALLNYHPLVTVIPILTYLE